MSSLTPKQIKYLRASAHDLKPVAYVGHNGLSKSVLNDIDRALDDHDLIKVRFTDYKDEKKALTKEIAEKTGASLVGITGHLACLYRRSRREHKQRIVLPD